MFIAWRMKGNVLEIYDIYSEEPKGEFVKFIKRFIKCSNKAVYVDGSIDKEYRNFNRSHELLSSFGMKPYRETEEFVYYRMERENEVQRWEEERRTKTR